MAYIEMKHSYKRYQVGESEIVANNDINFAIEKGELVIILGSSGAGKSTVLNILGGMDTNDEGQVIIDGKDISGYSAKELTTYRRNDVGFVFQFYNLVPNLTAKENVELASEIVADARDATETLADVGLEKRINNFPAQLSGGEQQRVSIARAVAKNPKLLLCDEPTGALDYQTGKQVLKILQNMSRKEGATVIIVTHNSALAPIADRVIHMHDARVSSIELNGRICQVALDVYNSDGTLGVYCPDVDNSAARTARDEALNIGQTAVRGSIGSVASSVLRTGAGLIRSASGGTPSVTVPSGYTVFLMKTQRR